MLRVALLLLALATAAGCGAGPEEPGVTAFTATQVSREFQQRAGRALEEAAVPDAAWLQLGYGLDPPPSVVRRFGVFNVYVVEPGNDEAVDSLLRDKATGEPLPRDRRGIHWELDSQSRTWVAYTRYGANVVLAWFSERKAKATDERWARLDRILAGL